MIEVEKIKGGAMLTVTVSDNDFSRMLDLLVRAVSKNDAPPPPALETDSNVIKLRLRDKEEK